MSRFKTILLLSVAIPGAATGLWALLAPRSWHDGFPGFGRDWVPVFGPFNEHLARDYGSALLGLSALLAISALKPHVRLQRAAAGGFLVFATPHLVFHLVHFGELPLGDDIVSIATILLSVAIPAAVLLSSGQAPARVPPRGPDGWRLPPAPERGLLARLSYAYSRRRFGHVLGPIALTAHNPILLAGYSTMELALERADRIDRPLEELAATRAATMTGCPFCMDYAGGAAALAGLQPGAGRRRAGVA